MALKPLGDRVIVKADEAVSQTAGGLFMAGDAKEKPQTGVVIAVGEGKIDKDGFIAARDNWLAQGGQEIIDSVNAAYAEANK